MKIAVLLTTFNRREKTLSCLERLEQQVLPNSMQQLVFLTDDQSSDGTAMAVRTLHPATYVFEGTGSLYWAGGMRATWREALKHDADFYLLLNDDTALFPNALSTLIALSANHPRSICVGSTCDAASGTWSYGGAQLLAKKVWKSERVFSAAEPSDCDFANANIMLVPRAVVQEVGILSEEFTHSLADYDYCIRAKQLGFSIKLAAGFLGTCVDDHGNNWKSTNSTLRERIQYLKSPKGLAYSEYLGFIRLHFPRSYPAAFCKLWMKTFFPFIWDRFKK